MSISYAVGYKLAVCAKARDDEKLGESALTQIRLRHQSLLDGQRLSRWRTEEQDGTLHKEADAIFQPCYRIGNSRNREAITLL